MKRPPLRGAILVFVLLRCAVLLTLEAPEPRYTLEWFPPLIALAAVALRGEPGSASGPVESERQPYLFGYTSPSSSRSSVT